MHPEDRDQRQGRAGEPQVFRAPVLLSGTVVFLTTLAAQALVGLVWPSTTDGLRWSLFSLVFTLGHVVLWRPWLRVGAQELRAGNGPFVRRRISLRDVSAVRPHDGGPGPGRRGRRGRRHGPRTTDLYPGWGPAVVVERADGSRLVVGVPDVARVLSAVERVGGRTDARSGRSPARPGRGPGDRLPVTRPGRDDEVDHPVTRP